MKKNKYILVIVLIISLAARYSSIQAQKTALAGTRTNITIQAAPDFSIKLPVSWKDNYVLKSSNKIKHGSYVAFYAKKCYKQAKNGWLFTIMRYKDNSYIDMPSYELAGKWNGYNYVALFPTDIQTEGATETAKRQYIKLNASSGMAAASVMPVKKAKKEKCFYRFYDFSLKLPDSWKGNYIVKKSGNNKDYSYVAFYAKKCYKQSKAGWLFSIGRYADESYQELPYYELVGKWNGTYYVAVFPTDVQFAGVTKTAMKQYQKLDKPVKKIIKSVSP